MNRFLIAILALAVPAMAQMTSPDQINGIAVLQTPRAGRTQPILASSVDSISSLCASLGSNLGTVEVTSSLTLSGNTTIPSNCTLRVESGGKITIPEATTLTVNGGFEAGLRSIFTFVNAGTSRLVFNSNTLDSIRPQWFGATADGVHDDSPAIQRAIDIAAFSVAKQIKMASGNYLVNTALNVTSGVDPTYGITIHRDSITVISEGRRGGTVISLNTGGVGIDLSGSAWTTWKGLFIQQGSSNPSTAAFLMAGTNTFTECLYHTFENNTVQMYLQTYSVTYGAVDFLVVGSEENTWAASNINGNTNFVFTTNYSTISSSYPSPYRNAEIQSSHSSGVNTFSGENSLLTFDSKSANVVLLGANSLDFGNIYMGGVDFNTPGTVRTAIRVIGGTLENYKGHVKMESRDMFMEVFGSELYSWNMQVAFGGTPVNSNPIVLFHADTRAVQKIIDFTLNVSYFDPSNAAFLGKKMFDTTGTPNPAQPPVLGNITTSVNQMLRQYNTYPWPAWFNGLMQNGVAKFADTVLTCQGYRLGLLAPTSVALGLANSRTPVNLATLHLPPVLGSTNAQGVYVRLKGLVTNIDPRGEGRETLVASGLVDTSVGAQSPASGAIVVGASPSDTFINTTAATSVSGDGKLITLTGANLVLAYNSEPRTISIQAYPTATGANVDSFNVWISNMEIEVSVDGVPQRLNYLSF
jgi:hypothetical protein